MNGTSTNDFLYIKLQFLLLFSDNPVYTTKDDKISGCKDMYDTLGPAEDNVYTIPRAMADPRNIQLNDNMYEQIQSYNDLSSNKTKH